MTSLVTFGETMLRLSPPAGTRLETATELEFRTAGAESNVAVAASRLGIETVWLSKLPDSALGRRVTTELEGHGVDSRVAWEDDSRQGTYYIEQGSTPRPTNVIYDRTDAAITTARAAELDTEPIEAAEVFYTSGITPALSDVLETTTRELLTTARESGTTTAFDLNYRSKLWSHSDARTTYESLLEHVDVLAAAERDVRAVLDRDGTPDELATALATDFDLETVLLTRGDEGALAVHGDDTYEQPAFDVDTVDPIGTGDSFVGAYLTRRIRGDTVDDALAYAAAAAALKRTIAGDLAVITPEEVEQVLDASHSHISR